MVVKMNELERFNKTTNISYEEFMKEIDKRSEPENFVDKVSDIWDSCPVQLKLLTKLDKTGIADSIISILEDNKAKRESDKILKALYALYCGIQDNKMKTERLLEEKVPILIEQFFQYSKIIEDEKIEFIRNSFFYGVQNSASRISEDMQIMELIKNLTLDEISILVYSVKKLGNISYEQQRESFDRITLDEIVNSLNIKREKAVFSCMSLIGKGLLEDWGIGRLDYSGPKNYIINDYTKIVIQYALYSN